MPVEFLAVLPLAYTSCMRLPTQMETEEKRERLWSQFERTSEMFISRDCHGAAGLECDSVLARILFLRTLTKALELCAGSLDDLPSLATDPELRHLLKQATSLTVIEKILRSTIKRHIISGWEAGASYTESGDLLRARWKCLATAELAFVVSAFESNPWFQQRWIKPVKGAIPYKYSLIQRASEVCHKLGHSYEDEARMLGKRGSQIQYLTSCLL